MHRLDLGLYSHPLYRKCPPEEERTRDTVDSEPKHYQLSCSGPRNTGYVLHLYVEIEIVKSSKLWGKGLRVCSEVYVMGSANSNDSYGFRVVGKETSVMLPGIKNCTRFKTTLTNI